MATDQAESIDTQTRRAEEIAELDQQEGTAWRERFAPGTLGCHELLDRTAMIAGLVDEHILQHPACVQSEHWFRLAHSASDALNALYQAVGAVHLDDEPDAPK